VCVCVCVCVFRDMLLIGCCVGSVGMTCRAKVALLQQCGLAASCLCMQGILRGAFLSLASADSSVPPKQTRQGDSWQNLMAVASLLQLAG
jgi:hypothetical protein